MCTPRLSPLSSCVWPRELPFAEFMKPSHAYERVHTHTLSPPNLPLHTHTSCGRRKRRRCILIKSNISGKEEEGEKKKKKKEGSTMSCTLKMKIDFHVGPEKRHLLAQTSRQWSTTCPTNKALPAVKSSACHTVMWQDAEEGEEAGDWATECKRLQGESCNRWLAVLEMCCPCYSSKLR